MNSLVDLFAQIQSMMAADAGFFMSIGLIEFSALSVILLVWFGIQWALAGGMAMDRFANMLLKLSFGFAMIHFYTTPLGIFGGRDFHHLISDEGQYLANQLNNGTVSNLFTSLDSVMQGMKQPGLTALLNIPEIIEWVIVFLTVVVLESAVWVVIAWGFIASAVCVLLGPVLIPFYIIPPLDWMFWGWLKAFVQYSFYPVVANAVVYVFGRLLTNYIAASAPPWDGAQQWALLAPMLIMMLAFTYGVLKVPTLVNDIFAGRSGSSAVPTSIPGLS